MRLLALVLGAVLALSGCGTEFVADPPREGRRRPPKIVQVEERLALFIVQPCPNDDLPDALG